jgi:hypothetical protein
MEAWASFGLTRTEQNVFIIMVGYTQDANTAARITFMTASTAFAV